MNNREVCFISIQSAAAVAAAAVAAAAAASAVCCCTAAVIVAAAAVLLLPAAVTHRVPDDQICCCFIESDPSVLFLFIQTRFSFDVVPLGSTLSHLRPRFCLLYTSPSPRDLSTSRMPSSA